MEGKAETNRFASTLKGKISVMPRVDKTLAIEGHAADAKATGDKLAEVNNRINNLDPHTAANVLYKSTNGEFNAENVQRAIEMLAAIVVGGVTAKDFNIKKSSPAMRLSNAATGRGGEAHYSNSNNLILSNKKDDDNMVGIWVKPETEKPQDYLDLGTYINGEFTRYPIFGTHNKPKGKYAGTGTATSYTVTIGGIGTTLKISTTKGMAIITGAGAICKKYADTAVYGLAASTCKFEDGVLTLATADEVVNSARDIYYEVL